MSVGTTNYPQPVQVNGFTCHNCTDVDNAKKHIDPAHPKSGPYGVNAATDPSNKKSFIQFGGSLSATQANATQTSASGTSPAPNANTPSTSQAVGQSLDIQA